MTNSFVIAAIRHLLFVALITPMVVSCISEPESVAVYEQPKADSKEITSLYIKIDSINEKYSKLIGYQGGRGYVSDYAIETAADAVGAFIGRKIFSWLGASVGAACGNPAVAVGGYLVGGQLGKGAGAAVASIGAVWLKDNCCRSSSSHNLILNEDYFVYVNDPNNLSDGELHNLIVAKLLKSMDKYVTNDSDLNYMLLLEDAFAYEKELCPKEEYPYDFKELWLSKTLEQTKRIINSSLLLASNDSNEFLDDVYENLIPEIQMTKIEFDNANILNRETLSIYMVLDDSFIKAYSDDIDMAIDNSILNTELKSDLKSSNSILLNSTLIWREVQPDGNQQLTPNTNV